MFNGDDAWSYTPSDNDIDDQLNALETEEFFYLIGGKPSNTSKVLLRVSLSQKGSP